MGDAGLDRRRVLCGLSVGAATLRAGQAAAEVRRPALDPVRDLDLIYRKLAWSADGAATFSWLRGVRYALIDNVVHPLWAMHVGNVFRTRDLDHGFEAKVLSISVYTDLETGRFLRTVRNPITGADVEIGYFPPRPQTLVYGIAGRAPPQSGPLARLDQHAETGPAWIDGETISVWGGYRAYGGEAATAAPIRVNDLSTYTGALRDVADPRKPNPPSTMIFNDINTWPAWLGMGDRPGSYFSRAWGRKAFRLDAMPPVWRAGLAEAHPHIARDPIGALDQA